MGADRNHISSKGKKAIDLCKKHPSREEVE
jgi:hypothetical protein